MKQEQVELMVAKAMAKQAAQQNQTGNQMPMQLMANGGVNQAINFAAEDFVKAAVVLKRATNSYQTPFTDLKAGMQSFISQQFFRMNAAGLMCDALGYQGVTEMLAYLHTDATAYIETTMAGWNKVIEDEGEVKALYDKIAEEEKAAGKQSIQ